MTNYSLYGIIIVSKEEFYNERFDYMTILEAVNKVKGCTVRVQVMRDGYTQFIANDETTNYLLLGRVKNTPVERIKIEYENETPIVHIYGINYLNYHR